VESTALKARPTMYNGVQMRSRLEAKVAAQLETVGFTWEYEPNNFASPDGQYLPDFGIWTAKRFDGYVEVKPPNADLIAAARRMEIIWASEPDVPLYVFAPGAWILTGTNGSWRIQPFKG
jgi:hypothetical protein